MKYTIIKRTKCRICGSENLYLFLDFLDIPMTEGFTRPGSKEPSFTHELKLYLCASCFTVQTLHDVDLSDYYQEYNYQGSLSGFVKKFMRRFARDVWERFDLSEGDSVLDVGASDGYQLKCFKDLGARELGFEPSAQLAESARGLGVKMVQDIFTKSKIDKIPLEFRPVRAIIAQYTFDHLPNPVNFLEAAAEVLDPEHGLIVLEIHDLEKIFERNEACLFSHEHSIYLSTDTLASVFERAGFRLVCTDLVPQEKRRGNSLIAAGVLNDAEIPSNPPRESPILYALRKLESYDRFAERIKKSHENLAGHVREMRAKGKRVAGYGAAGRGVNTIAITRMTSDDLECVYDLNPNLHDLIMPGSKVPVKHPDELFSDPVDEVIVFSYGYLDEIREYLSPYIEKGGRVNSMLEYLRVEPDIPKGQ